MPNEKDFRNAIQANPDNLELRLIYADWLDERGDPRGKFMRIQVELKRAANTPSWKNLQLSSTISDLVNQQLELESEHGKKWKRQDGVCNLEDPDNGLTIFFENGFAEGLQVCIGNTYPNGQAPAPVYNPYHSSNSRRLKSILDHKSIICIQFTSNYSRNWSFYTDILVNIFNAKWTFWKLHELRLPGWQFYASDLALLCQSKLFTTKNCVKSLSLANNQITDQGIEHLIRTRLFENLETLNLNNNQLTANGIAQLLAANNSWKFLAINGQADEQQSIGRAAAQALGIKGQRFSKLTEELFARGIYI